MVMNKTELKKLQVKEVLEMLENEFGAQIKDNGDGGRLDIDINGFHGQFSRRDLDVAFWDTTKLSGGGWSKEQIQRQKDAVALEAGVNGAIQERLKQLSGLAFQD